MSTTYYAAPGAIVCVETGMPERAVRIGIGRTVGAARADLSETPMQSAGRDPVADALAWARNAAWLDIGRKGLGVSTRRTHEAHRRSSRHHR